MEWNFKVLDDNGEVVSSSKPEIDVTDTVPEEEVVEALTEEPTTEEEVQPDPLVEEALKEEPAIVSQEPEIPEVDVESLYARIKELEETNVQTNNVELPEDVSKFLEYKKETGRGFEDYLNLQKDWSAVDDANVLRQYYQEQKPHLSSEDIEFLISDQFSYDETLDDDRDVKKKQVAYKEELYKARQHFEGLKEKYKAPLESSAAQIPDDMKEAYDFYNEYKENSQKDQELTEMRAKSFVEKTNNLFNNEFKGFEFDLGEKKQSFVPKDVSKVKEFQSDISNFFAQHLDENGVVKDANAYHKALFAATNADAMAKYFYEQGRADATDGLVKETKNIDMSVRDNKDVNQGNVKFRVVEDSNAMKFGFKK